MTKRVTLLAATGLVGGQLLHTLLLEETVDRVVAVTRRPLELEHPKLDVRVFDLGEIERHPEAFGVDHVFCALGTTIAKAGSQERFRVVDYDYPLAAARMAATAGAHHFLLVSALGADAGSRFFYNRVKGELEDAVRTLPFRSITIARPSLLLGDRQERRRGEEIGARLGWLMPSKYKPIDAGAVARALVGAAREDRPGVRILESKEMRRG